MCYKTKVNASNTRPSAAQVNKLYMVINSFMFYMDNNSFILLTYIYFLHLCAITKKVFGTTAVNRSKAKLLSNFNFFLVD